MAGSTPPSHRGYLRYWGDTRRGGDDLSMADENDRLAEDAQRAAPPPFADRVDQRDHPAQPAQTDEGFAEGQEIKPDTPEEERVRDFAEGQEIAPLSEQEEDIGRFSEGQELLPETPDKVVERRFSEGQDAGPDTT